MKWNRAPQCAMLAVMTITAACARKDADGDGIADTNAPAAASMPAMDSTAGAMTDAQIVQSLLTANSLDSAAGAAAARAASSPDVRAFASDMMRDHGALNVRVTDLVNRSMLAPETSLHVATFESMATQSKALLAGKKGADYDLAYIDSEVAMHQSVLDHIDHDLMPQATAAELKPLLDQARASVLAHLERAKGLQSRMGKA